MSEVALKKPIFEWAVQRSGLSASKLRQKFPKLAEWLSGASNPTIKQLKAFAKATHTPFGYFFLEKPPEEALPSPHFRTVKDDEPKGPSLELLDTVHLMQLRQDWIREFFLEQGKSPLPFVGSPPSDKDPTAVADYIRAALKLEKDWAAKQKTWTDALQVLREAMEDAGIFVFANGVVGNNNRRKLSVDEFRGFVLVDSIAPLVFINGADGKAAQMFTLAHELAHVFLGSSAAFDLRDLQPASDPTEKACNEIAAEFLVPAAELKQVWDRAKTSPEPFQALARHF
jgi:Zn-dependent peptidase ImmA (M78 family)